MLKISSEAQLADAFRPLDRDGLVFPEGLKFPLMIRDYFAWVEPAGHQVFVVFEAPGASKPYAIAFRRNPGASNQGSRMCDWCHDSGSSQEIGLLTAQVSPGHTVGVHVCLDLSCKEKVKKSLLSHHPRAKIRQINERMLSFARSSLF